MYRKRDTDTETHTRVNKKVNDWVNNLLDDLKNHPDYTVTELQNTIK